MPKKAIIIGAGPAGLTAAYELLKRTDIVPVILERSADIGGISKTVNYKGNRMDIGGHRFFSKSDRVMEWWLNIMPIQSLEEDKITVNYQQKSKTIKTEKTYPKFSDKELPEKVMLVRNRLSRIYFLRKFFAYPIQLSVDTLKKLGLPRTVMIMLSYLRSRLWPRKPEKSLEDFFINRFGTKLYELFFKDYTEKVWGVPCAKISAEWGAQRIKGISIGKAISHAVTSLKSKTAGKKTDISQKSTETSLIEKFLYPKYGPGQLWEEVARQIREMGGKIYLEQEVKDILVIEDHVNAVITIDKQTSEISTWEGDYFFSTMPVKDLIAGMGSQVPEDIQTVAAGLQYRDFITVGILLKKIPNNLPDTWIYIQEKDVKVGRLQIFNNWSPYMVKDPDTIWLGLEYFCNKTDEFWQLSDKDIISFAILELAKMRIAQTEDVLDATILKVEKTYPAYFGTYDRFEQIRQYTETFDNLFLVGRNGMHKYNNSDHSMLTAMVAVDNISAGQTSKANIWAINTEQTYYEERSAPKTPKPTQAGAITPPPDESFYSFLFRNPWNRNVLLLVGIALILQFIVFKLLYPFAGFINADSYAYIQTAYFNISINTYPVGYSNFLRLISIFTTSDTALVAIQYLLLQSSALLLAFTLFYFFRPGKFIKVFLSLFIVINPVYLYLGNYISSDNLFISLSTLWFTLLIWLLYRPNLRLIILQAVILSFSFTVRYNALYYPAIVILALALCRQKLHTKLTGIAVCVLLIGAFIWNTSNQYKDLTGIRQFSPFSGWQIANNALFAYRDVDSANVKPVPRRFQELDRVVRAYFDSTKDLHKHPWEMLKANAYYMWDTRSPLYRYMNMFFKKDSSAKPFRNWAFMGPIYSDYGSFLIRQYPVAYARNYLWPNALKYFAPPVEFLDTYNMDRDTVMEIAKLWFHYKNKKVRTAFGDFKVSILDFYPILAGALNFTFLFSLVFFIAFQGFRGNPQLTRALILATSLWLANFGFSIIASPVALRFQLFPVFVSFSFSLLLFEYIYKLAFLPTGQTFVAPKNKLASTSDNPKLA